MYTISKTQSTTHTVTAADVRVVMEHVELEVKLLSERFRRLLLEFDADEDLTALSILVLNDVVESVHLQVFTGHELLVEFRFQILDVAHPTDGPAPGEAPDTPVPEGARVRLVVTPNPNKPDEYCDRWFERLGWVPAEPLEVADGATWQTYGHFSSGGFGVARAYMVSPRLAR